VGDECESDGDLSGVDVVGECGGDRIDECDGRW